MKILFTILFAGTSILFASCNKDNNEMPVEDNRNAKTILNVSYGTSAAQVMDVYLPGNRSVTSTKVMLLIHGGGWTSGDKNDPLFSPFVDSIKRRLPEYAVFNINYRLSAPPLNLFPSQELDIKAATEFIYARRNEYGISDKFVFVGASAGAHLAMLQAYKYNSPVKAKAVVSFFGPSDLLDMYNNPVGGNILISNTLAQTIGKTPAQDPLIYINSSPINFVTAGSAMPTILLHGGLDPLVNPLQSLAVKTKLTASGIANQYILYPTGGHGDWNSTLYTDAFNNVQAFLALHMQ
jgi:acetyl esterase/lipase